MHRDSLHVEEHSMETNKILHKEHIPYVDNLMS